MKPFAIRISKARWKSAGLVKALRTDVLRMSQCEFAFLTETNQSTIARWERGYRGPKLSHLKKVRDELKHRNIDWDDRWFFEIPIEQLKPATTAA